MKKLISILLVVALACIALASCGNAESEGTAYISLRINPEIELIADDDGMVLYANAVNEDGEVVLSTVELEGLSVAEASAAFTDKAIELGYLDPKSNEANVYVGVECSTTEESAIVEESIEKSIGDYFKNNGINGKVSKETLDKYAQRASQWGLSTGHTKLAMRVLDEYPNLTEEDVLSMDVSQWLDLLNANNGKNAEVTELKQEYKETVKGIKQEYERLFELRASIEDLENRLASEQLTDEEAASLEAQISLMEDEANELKDEYKGKLADAKSDYKVRIKEIRKASKK